MADEKKPFVCYKSGWNIKISPQTGVGWIMFGWWMAAMALLTGGFVWLMRGDPQGARLAAFVTLYALAMTLWALAMARWMYLRSDVIDMQDLLKLKRELDAKNGRRGR